MTIGRVGRLTTRERYIQVALDRDLTHVERLLSEMPRSDRVLVEVGTPLIKLYGANAIVRVRSATGNYLVADVKAMDRGLREVEIAASAGADAATVLGQSPLETLDRFIAACRGLGIESMVDMMNVEKPAKVLSRLREQPDVLVLHRGFDEHDNKAKELPLAEIAGIRARYGMPIAVAGGVDLRDAQKAVFNGANIVVLSDTLAKPDELPGIAAEFIASTK